MKKYLKLFTFLMASIFMINVVNAQNLEVVDDAKDDLHNAIGEVEAQIIKKNFNLDYVLKNRDYDLPDGFAFKTAKKYKDENDIVANFDTDRANGVLSYGGNSAFSGTVLTYTQSIPVNTIAEPDGTIQLKFKDTVIFNDETYGDLYLEISNIKIENNYKNTTKPVLLMNEDMGMASYFALQEVDAETLLDSEWPSTCKNRSSVGRRARIELSTHNGNIGQTNI